MGTNLLTRDGYKAVINEFKSISSGYANSTPKQRSWVARTSAAWLLNPKWYRHKSKPGYYSLWCKKRDQYFTTASEFKTAIDGLWVCDNHYNPWNKQTKAYATTEAATEVIMKRLIAEMDTPKPLESLDGRRISKPNPAIKGKHPHHNIQAMTPISRGTVRELLNDAMEQRRGIIHGVPSTLPRLRNKILPEQVEFLDRAIHSCRMVLYHSNYIGYPGMMPNYYKVSTAGRVVGIGLNLQNVPREIKQAALVGCFDHDIVNCHITIAEQLGRKLGCDTEALQWWIAVKADKRERALLADQFGTDADTLKQCMLALTYGAEPTTWQPNGEPLSIEQMLHEYTPDFMKHPEIKNFKMQLKNIRQKVIKDAKQSNDYLFNHLGRPLYLMKEKGKLVEEKSKFSHLLLGLEAQMLHHAIELYRDKIIQLSHDGFVTREPIDTKRIAKLYKQSTGLVIEFKTKPLKYPLAA